MTGLITRLNPLVLIAVGLMALLSSFGVRTLLSALVTAGVYVVVMALVVPDWRYPALCVLGSSLPVVSVMWSTWLLGGRVLETTLIAGLRMFVLTWPGAVAIGYLDAARVGDYLAQSLRLPARFAAAFSAALQRMGGTWRTWHELSRVRRARGLRVRPAPMAFAMLVRAMRDVSSVAIAMDARGFADADGRTWAEPATWTRLDRAALAVSALVASTPWWMTLALR